MAKQKYWKTVITTIVLTAGDDAPDYGGDLSSVAEDIDTGDAVGSSTFKSLSRLKLYLNASFQGFLFR
jgi:hypothetical protein